MARFATYDRSVAECRTSPLSPLDPVKLQRQIRFFGASIVGMAAPWVVRGSDGELMLMNGVTRATRIAKLSPGTPIKVEIIDDLPGNAGHLPTIGDLLP